MSSGRVLVTGATGFVGRHTLAPLINGGHEVHAVARRPGEAHGDGVCWHAADLLDGAAIRALVAEVRPERMLHLAWYAEHGLYWAADENLAWVGASLELLRAFAAAGGRRAVLAGTCAEYAWGGTAPLHEQGSSLAPASLYGAAKHALAIVASPWAAQSGVSLAWGRIFFLYGPHEHPERLVSSIARRLAAGRPAPCSTGEQRRDFMHVADAAAAFVALVDSAVEGPVNIAAGQAPTVAELAVELGRLAGRPELIRLGELPARPGDPAVIAADVERLRHEVGFDRDRDLSAGLADALAWWRARPLAQRTA